jgi:hemoglobin
MRKSSISDLFPQDASAFEAVKKHSADFFVQICGGPPYFNQNRGKPMLINRHAPFKITYRARLVWLDCYRDALAKLTIPDELILSFWNYINVFSIWMVNTDETPIVPPNQ